MNNTKILVGLVLCVFVFLPLFSFEVRALTGTTQKPPNNLGLEGYWSFDEGNGTKTTDASGNGDTGTITNMESSDWVVGRKDDALEFDGSDEYVDLGTAVLDITGDVAFTMCAWINTDSISTAQAVVATGNASVALNAVALFINSNSNGAVSLEFAGANTATTAGGMITVGEWYHVCGVKTAGAINTTSTLYVNGQSVAIDSASSNTPTVSTTDASIGQFVASGSYFDGKIDDVRVYSRALSAGDVLNLYNAKVGQLATSRNQYLTNGLLLLYSFDGLDVISETVYDRSGQGNNGTTENFSTTTTPSAGQIGQAFYFDAGSIKVTSGSNVSISDAGSRTISVWGKLDDAATDGALVSLGSAGDNTLFAPVCLSSTWQINGYGLGNDFDTAVACNYEWHHHLITYNGTDAVYYLDGVQIGSFTHTYATTLAVAVIGARPDEGITRWAGLIDDVRIYNRVLSSSEITRLYSLGRSTGIQ
ncbi:MAG: LamG domain-containing protein [Patescibacteria group bacterium]